MRRIKKIILTKHFSLLLYKNRGDYSGYEIRLYNITADPSEETDLSDDADYADTLATMLTELAAYDATMIDPNDESDDHAGDPDASGNFVTGWCTAE